MVVEPLFAPAGARWHVEVFAGVLIWVRQAEGDVCVIQPLGLALLSDVFAPLVKQVAGAFEEEHAKDVFLVLARVHVAAQVVAGGEQQAFQP